MINFSGKKLKSFTFEVLITYSAWLFNVFAVTDYTSKILWLEHIFQLQWLSAWGELHQGLPRQRTMQKSSTRAETHTQSKTVSKIDLSASSDQLHQTFSQFQSWQSEQSLKEGLNARRQIREKNLKGKVILEFLCKYNRTIESIIHAPETSGAIRSIESHSLWLNRFLHVSQMLR